MPSELYGHRSDNFQNAYDRKQGVFQPGCSPLANSFHIGLLLAFCLGAYQDYEPAYRWNRLPDKTCCKTFRLLIDECERKSHQSQILGTKSTVSDVRLGPFLQFRRIQMLQMKAVPRFHSEHDVFLSSRAEALQRELVVPAVKPCEPYQNA